MISALWEVPLAILSFGFYRVTRFILRRLVVLHSRRKGALGYVWGVLSSEPLSKPFALPALMTTGPRWNTHAIIGAAGPVTVNASISLDVEALEACAEVWTAVVYTFPKQKPAGLVGSVDGPFRERWRTIPLTPGQYNLVVRLYHVRESPSLPEVRVDGQSAIPRSAVDPRANDFYHDLGKRRSLFYLFLHFYIYTLLRLGAPRWMIEPELLPMGNPETQFLYGAVPRGAALEFAIPPAVLSDHGVYCTVYTRDSFPARWFQITQSTHQMQPVAESGFFLVRIHRKRPGAGEADLSSIRIDRL